MAHLCFVASEIEGLFLTWVTGPSSLAASSVESLELLPSSEAAGWRLRVLAALLLFTAFFATGAAGWVTTLAVTRWAPVRVRACTCAHSRVAVAHLPRTQFLRTRACKRRQSPHSNPQQSLLAVGGAIQGKSGTLLQSFRCEHTKAPN